MENELLKRIEELEKAVHLLTKIVVKQYGFNKSVVSILETLSVRSDKELYETILNTDENSKLYNEEDLKW